MTPGASALRRKAAADRETLSSALPRLEAANRVMQAISDGVEQDREAAEDILGAFVDIGGDLSLNQSLNLNQNPNLNPNLNLNLSSFHFQIVQPMISLFSYLITHSTLMIY